MSLTTVSQVPRVGVGCIVHHAGRVLLVRSHRGLWSTPGGHLDFGESPEATAVRETLEETGVAVGTPQFIGITNDLFGDPLRHYLTVWFRAAAEVPEIAIGDAEEIAEAAWFDPETLPVPRQPFFENFLAGRTLPGPQPLLPCTEVMMEPVSPHSTRLTRHIAAPRAEVYRALLDPVAVASWMVPDGMTGHIHEFDAREGGRFRITLSYDSPTGAGKTTPHSDTYHGQFEELVLDERVVQIIEFETEDPTMRGEMLVTYTLAEAEGGTLLSAAHDDLPPGLSPEDNELGWRLSLEKLERLLARA